MEIKRSQFHAVFSCMLTGRADTFYLHYVTPGDSIAIAFNSIKAHFDTEANKAHYYNDWTITSFDKIRRENPILSLQKFFNSFLTNYNFVKEHLVLNMREMIFCALQSYVLVGESLNSNRRYFEPLLIVKSYSLAYVHQLKPQHTMIPPCI